MTLREVSWRMAAIEKRRLRDLRMSAKMHDKDLKMPVSVEIDDSVADKADKYMAKRLEGINNG